MTIEPVRLPDLPPVYPVAACIWLAAVILFELWLNIRDHVP